MNKQQLIEELIDELCLVSPDGLPNVHSRESLSFIWEYFASKGLYDLGNQVIQNLYEAGEESKQFKNPILNKKVKYKDRDNNDKEGVVGNLLRLKKGEPGRDAAEKLLPPEGSPERDAINTDLGGEGQPQRDIEKEKEKGGEDQAKPEQPKPNAFDPKTSGGLDYIKNLPDNDPAKPEQYKNKSKSEKDSQAQADSDKEQLKQAFSKKSEATDGLIYNEYKKLPNGTEVRQLVGEDGNPIDVSNSEGRKKAVELIDKRLESLNEKTQIAIKNFDKGLVVVQKWLGEIGELSALKQILAEDVEAYLLTDSERKNDIAFVKSNGESEGLFTGFISVKTTKGGGGVNKRGANCKADLDKLVKSGDEEYEVNGIKLKPENVMGSIVDVKSGLFKQFTGKSSGEVNEKVSVNGKQQKLTRYDKQRHGEVDPKELVTDSKGNTYFASQAAFLRNKTLSLEDAEAFFNDAENNKYFTNLNKPSKQVSNAITDNTELQNTKKYIKEYIVNEIKNWRKKHTAVQKDYTLADLHETMFEIVGGVIEDANIKIGVTGDTMAVHYNEGKNEPKIGVIKKEDANVAVQKNYEEVSKMEDTAKRRMFLSIRCLGMSSRTRALGKDLYYDGIDNMEPVGNLDESKETPLAKYITER